MYISIRAWRDLTDGHLYAQGETFPHDGRIIPPERAESLLTGNNQAGLIMIREEAQPAKQETQQQAANGHESAPETQAEQGRAKPRKTRRSAK